jgi:Flp pilus assembly protein TadB
MRIDHIVKEELLRSLAIYWILFLIIAISTVGGYLPLSTASAFPLAAILTAIYFGVMVWYRRKENLHDPNPISILRHALRSGEQGEEKTKQRRALVEKVTDAFLVVTIFLIYLYASFAYSISQIYWLPVLILIGLFLARIVFTDGGEHRVTLARLVVFYLIAAAIIVLRYLALRYLVFPLLQAIVLIGVVSFPILYVWERRSAPKGKD